MLEIHETLSGDLGWDDVSLYAVVDDLLWSDRLGVTPADEIWPDGRILYAECVVSDGGEVVGLGRLVWDMHIEGAVPTIHDLCLRPKYRTPFVIDTMESVLIDYYAEEAAGGEMVLGHDGREIDISERVERLRDLALGYAEQRVI